MLMQCSTIHSSVIDRVPPSFSSLPPTPPSSLAPLVGYAWAPRAMDGCLMNVCVTDQPATAVVLHDHWTVDGFSVMFSLTTPGPFRRWLSPSTLSGHQ